jgi:phosphatidylserine/phosphatidylglycerophosphate/cardiolipin synthase-like enzyme
MVKKFSEKEFDDNLNNIGKYIMIIYNSENGKKLDALHEYLQISSTSFSYINGLKPFEGYASKKDEPRAINSVFKLVTRPVDFFKGWNKRWIVLKEDMISYLKDRTALSGKNVYWFDENVEISTTHDKIIELKNLSKTLLLKFETKFERDLWKREIELRVNKIKEGIMNNKYSSFSSQKSNCGAKWFVDGESYFGYLLNQLKGAKESVYITDWFISPELALKRPINYEEFVNDPEYQKKLTFGNMSRLMDVLYLLAKKGVKIFILIYCEVSLALAINSANAKATLKKLHPNIVVTRHPKNTTTLLWSHHEKLVIIDQKMAFVGGLDLCWGRYDSHQHPIVEEENLTHLYYYPGSDYVNERQVDFHDVDKFWQEQLDRNSMPRMAWHDVHTMVEGPVVGDIVRHFIERWDDARFNRVNQGLVTAGTSSFSFDAGGESKKDKKKREKEQKKKEKEKKKEEKAKGKKKVF